MNRKTLIFVFIAILTLCFASMAQAQATRTWVSGVGDDANPCSRTAPCKTFAGAISKTATNGEISVLDPGGFGAVTITKAITINGDGTLAGILAANTVGIIINAPTTAVVTIRNVSIHGAGNGTDGIRILAAKAVNIENCSIQGFINQGIDIIPSTAGLVLQVSVMGTQIRHNTQQGIQVLPSGTATVKLAVTDSVVNNHGLAGIDIAGVSNTASVTRTTMSNNNPGLQVQQSTSTAMIDNCLVANNTNGVVAGGVGTVVRVHNSTISGNTTAAAGGSGTVVGFFSNMVVGNAGTNTLTGASVAQQ
ncbi:MAG TPA: right-handed parallel beta-helix repeat-containing protein [Thermoanaerobaculia bacterium]|nr:right-handed parallel beta-helix repeat-containing protein [Thermoanaerobaculia bacterium]